MNSLRAPDWLPSFLVPFVTLSYPTATPAVPDSFHNSAYYRTGPLDVCLVVGCIAVMAVLRDATRLGLMEPFAKWKLMRDLKHSRNINLDRKASQLANGDGNGHSLNGHAAMHGNGGISTAQNEGRKMHRKVIRFAEQGWSVIYYTLTWCYGLYVHINVPTKLSDPTDLWLHYPHIPIAGPVKFYYLVQAAFYIHQVLILNAEARRKDHVQMMTHHVITIALIGASYFANFTRVGCVLLVLMDWCDIWLPFAKMLRYIDLSTLCDITFTWFLVSWFVTRHVLFVFVVIRSTYIDLPRLVPFAWAPERNVYLSKPAWVIYVTLLCALQVIQIVWFWMICRVAWRVVRGENAADDRSDEGSDEDEDRKDR